MEDFEDSQIVIKDTQEEEEEILKNEEQNEDQNDAQEENETTEDASQPKRKKRKVNIALTQDGKIDRKKTTLRDIIKGAANIGKPTRAAAKREEQKRKKKQGLTEKEENNNNASNNDVQIIHTEISGIVEEENTEIVRNRDEEDPNIEHEEVVIQATPRASSSQPTTNFAPQVTIVDGKIVLNEETLTVNTEEHAVDEYSTVLENSNYITSSSYANRGTSEKWSPKDTALFYRALRMYGTDFSLIEKLFPKRTRRQIKSKFKKEEKEHPDRINEALRRRLPIDLEEFAMLTKIANKMPADKPPEDNLTPLEVPPPPTASLDNSVASIGIPKQQPEEEIKEVECVSITENTEVEDSKMKGKRGKKATNEQNIPKQKSKSRNSKQKGLEVVEEIGGPVETRQYVEEPPQYKTEADFIPTYDDEDYF